MAATRTSRTARSAAARRPNRWRGWWLLAAISVGWKVIVLTVGAAIPRWMLDDGIAALPGWQQAYGREANHMALAALNGPIERHGVVRRVRVVRVDSLDQGAPCAGLGAVVRAYTYFAIPYSEVRTGCGAGVVQYRVFRRRPATARRAG